MRAAVEPASKVGGGAAGRAMAEAAARRRHTSRRWPLRPRPPHRPVCLQRLLSGSDIETQVDLFV